MKKTVFTLFCFLLASLSYAAESEKDESEENWKLNGITGLNMSQTSFTNWSAGGDNAFAGNLYLNGGLSKKTGRWLWTNSMALEYGLSYTKSKGNQKAADRLELGTQLGYSTDNKWYYTAAADFKTQFYKGYNYPDKENYISKLMAPGYLNLSVGMEYRPKDKFFSVYFSPLAGKFTFVRDQRLSDEGAFGVKRGKKLKSELGAYLKGKAEKDIMENVKLITTVDFFTAYDKSFGNVDVNWDVMLSMKVNKFLSASINTSLKYDDDVKYIDSYGDTRGARVQFKEVVGVGLAYNF